MMTETLGFGLGLRTKHYGAILETRPRTVDWFEFVSENFLAAGGRPRQNLDKIRELYPLVAHGVGLSIASTDPLPKAYLDALARLVAEIEPALVTDHLCWTRHHGQNSHDLLPVAYTGAALQHVKERVQAVQDRLKRRIFLENPSAYVSLRASEMGEAEFLRELADRSGCGVLLDVNNLYVNSKNLGLDPTAYLDLMRGEDICYFHLAGHSVLPDIRIDTHDEAVPEEVWALYREAARRFPRVPTLVEWDDHLPEFPGLVAELDKARAAHAAATAGVAVTGATRAGYEPRKPSPPAESALTWRQVQDEFWAVMTGEQRVDAADRRVAALAEPGLPAAAARGLNAYVDAYFFRIADVIRETYPALDNVVGASAFYALLRGFIAAHPPTEASIKYAGRGLAGYLLTAALPADYGVAREALRDIAALEWARTDIYDEADGPSPVGLGALQEIAPEAWETVRFSFVHALRLVRAAYAVEPVLDAVSDGKVPARPAAQTTSYLLTRPDLATETEILPEDAADLLAAMLAGDTFFQACAGVAATSSAELDGAFVGAMIAHLSRWVAQGLVAGIEL